MAVFSDKFNYIFFANPNTASKAIAKTLKDKLDGKAGMQTRAALGAYQKSAGLKVDCWPSEAVLRSMSGGRCRMW